MLVSGFSGSRNALRKHLAGLVGAGFTNQELAIHLIARNVISVSFKKRAEVSVRRPGVAGIHAFKRQAVARERIIRLFRDELFERLAAGFLLSRGLFGHGSVPYYTGARESIQTRREKGICMKRKTIGSQAVETGPAGKPVSASRSEMTEIVLPAQTNPLGKLLGGHVMHLVDMAAAMAAHRHSNSYVVTASVDHIDFRNPVNLGEIVILKSQVNCVFQTSLEVGVEVYSENVLTGEKKHTTTAYVTFVAVDEHTRLPKPVPPLIVTTPDEKRRFHEAASRRETRLALRYGK